MNKLLLKFEEDVRDVVRTRIPQLIAGMLDDRKDIPHTGNPCVDAAPAQITSSIPPSSHFDIHRHWDISVEIVQIQKEWDELDNYQSDHANALRLRHAKCKEKLKEIQERLAAAIPGIDIDDLICATSVHSFIDNHERKSKSPRRSVPSMTYKAATTYNPDAEAPYNPYKRGPTRY